MAQETTDRKGRLETLMKERKAANAQAVANRDAKLQAVCDMTANKIFERRGKFPDDVKSKALPDQYHQEMVHEIKAVSDQPV